MALWTISIATLVSRQAGLSLEAWVPTNFALEYAPAHSHQGAPLVSVGKPCYSAEIHLNPGPKTLLYDGAIPSLSEAANYVGFPVPHMDGLDRPEEIHLWRPDAASFLERVAALCQDRENIEKSLKPWGEGELLINHFVGSVEFCGICGDLWL